MGKQSKIPRLTDPWSRFILDHEKVWEVFHETTHDPELRKLDDYSPYFESALEDARAAIEADSYQDAMEAVMFAHGVCSLQWTWNEDMGQKDGPSSKWKETLAPLKDWVLKAYDRKGGKRLGEVVAGLREAAAVKKKKGEDRLKAVVAGLRETAAATPQGWNKRNGCFLKICGHPKTGGDKLGWATYRDTYHDDEYCGLGLNDARKMVEELAREAVETEDRKEAIVMFAMAYAIAHRVTHDMEDRDRQYKFLARFNEILAIPAFKIVKRHLS